MTAPETVGVGPTDELSLRASVASLTRVVFSDPRDGQFMLALERKATLHPSDGRVTVKAQPFGGALRIENLLPLKERIGDFHFDSQRSRSELDFRLFIRPDAWEAARDFCLEQFDSLESGVLESTPDRELAEEFEVALGMTLSPDHYRIGPLWTILENEPAPTGNLRAENQQTVRLYRVFDVQISNVDLANAMQSNSESHPDDELGELARENALTGGAGWANAMLVLPLESLISFYRAMPGEERDLPADFEGFHLEPNVTALLNGVLAPKYRRV